MKQTVFSTQLCILSIILAFTSISCRLSSDEPATASPGQRFLTLMRLYASENRPLLNEECNTQEQRDAFLSDLDILYRQLIQNGDIGTFQSVADIDSHVAASIGVWGVMEIVSANYMFKPSSKRLREQSLEMLGDFTSHSSPHVRSAALYSLGVMRQREFKDLVISRLGDTAKSSLFFPPFIESDFGMSTDVHTQACQALIKMVGKTEANPNLQAELEQRYSKRDSDSGEKEAN